MVEEGARGSWVIREIELFYRQREMSRASARMVKKRFKIVKAGEPECPICCERMDKALQMPCD